MTTAPTSPPTLPSTPAVPPRRDLKTVLLRWIDVIGPSLALIAVFLFFLSFIGTKFASFGSLETMCRQSTIVCMGGLGATFIIIAAGIDLSIGSVVAMAAITIAVMLKWTHADPAHPGHTVTMLHTYPIAWALCCGIGGVIAGTIGGIINGAMVTGFRLNPFIVTLATMMIFRGASEAISNEQAVNPPSNWLDNILAAPILPQWVLHSPFRPLLEILYLAPGVWLTIGLAIIMAVVLNYTRFGRHVIAVGSNENTARLCGIPVNRIKILVYSLGGLFAGFAGLMQYSRTNQGSPSAGIGLELDVIAAAVIGGASLNGGKGSILGTIVGSLIMTVIASGCSQLPIPHFLQPVIHSPIGLPTYIQKIVTGCIIVAAVSLDQFRQRRPS